MTEKTWPNQHVQLIDWDDHVRAEWEGIAVPPMDFPNVNVTVPYRLRIGDEEFTLRPGNIEAAVWQGLYHYAERQRAA